MSPLAEYFYVSDFMGRYNEHDRRSHYAGTKYAMEIENLCVSIIGARFNTRFVDVRPISGAIANLCAFRALLKPGDIIISAGIRGGGHMSATRYGIAGVIGVKEIPMVLMEDSLECDVDATVKLIERVRPKAVILGRSVFLFPEPVKELRDQIDDRIRIVYDAAHVFGLIWAGEFQNPLEEGADLMTASTHKTFPGPQGGVIVGASGISEDLWERVERMVFPGVISNHHLHRLPSLAITAIEMNVFGKAYARQIRKNAKALAESLYSLGFNVLCKDKGFTETHQVLVDVRKIGGGKVVSEILERNNIIVTKIALPWDRDEDATKNPSGIRLGVQEMTRIGMTTSDMEYIAELMYRAVIRKENVVNEVKEFRSAFQEVKYGFSVDKIPL